MRSQARHRHPHFFLDREGSLLIEHLSRGQSQALELEEQLGLPPLQPLGIMWSAVRVEGLDAATRARVLAAAADQHWDVTEVDKLDPPPPPPEPSAAPSMSTVEAIHAHSLAPSRKEKVIVPFIVLGIIAAVGAIGYVIWDHGSHDYGRVRSVADLLARAGQPRVSQGGLGALINPDDSRYVAWDVTGWQAWVGDAAITENTLVGMPGLDVPMDELVKGDRGSARVVFRMDLSRSQDGTFLVESIVRAGIKIKYRDVPLTLQPLKVGEAPMVSSAGEAGAYSADKDIRYDQDKTFRAMNRIAVTGFLEDSDQGLRLVNKQYRVAVAPVTDPGLRAIIDRIKLDPQESREYDAYLRGEGKLTVNPAKRVNAFISLEEIYDMGTADKPGPRRTERALGLSRLDGLQVGRVYVAG